MTVIKKLFLLIISLTASLISSGQKADCYDKTLVNIVLPTMQPKVINYLNEKYGEKSADEWHTLIDSRILEIMQTYHPEIEFSSYRKNPVVDPHYRMFILITLNTVDGKIIVPASEYTIVDPLTGWLYTEWADPVYESNTVFWIIAKLATNYPCLPERGWVLAVELSKDPEYEQCIKNIASLFWPLERNILLYEKDHGYVPPREPELDLEFSRDYLSLVKKEDREVKITGKVKNCLGNYVTWYNDGAAVFYQKEVNRLEFRHSKECMDGPPHGEFLTVLTNKNYEAIGNYSVVEGIDASREKIKFGTCGIQKSSEYYIERELDIRGLEVKIKPDRTQVYHNETTDIRITLKETDPDGNKYPVEGQEINVKITGIDDGTITAENGYITDKFGDVILNYHAGNRDKRIDIAASFQPSDYPEKTEDKSSITVKAHEYVASVVIKGRITKKTVTNFSETKNEGSCIKTVATKHNADEYVEASIYISLKRDQVVDMPVLNQTFEYYTPVSVSLSNFSYSSIDEKYDLFNNSGAGCAVGGAETITEYIRSARDYDIESKEHVTKSTWMLVIDNESGKAVKIIPAGYNIEYKIDEVELIHSTSWSDKGKEGDTYSNRITISRTFPVGPVADEVADPTVKTSETWISDYLKRQGVQLPAGVKIPQPSNQEVIKQIHPDIIVTFGDGKTSFGGEGTKNIDEKIPNGMYWEDRYYRWNMTRIKR